MFKIKDLFFGFNLIVLLANVLSDNLNDEVLKNSTNETQCQNNSRLSTTLLVGFISSLIFSFIGVLPSFFIRNDLDEERFSI